MSQKQNIVIIEDNETFALLITHYLKNNLTNANVYIENSGRKAIHSIKRMNPVVVVLDYYLEDQVSAKDVMETINQMDRPAKVILLSSNQNEIEINEVMQMGVHSYLPKANESIYALLKCIQSILSELENSRPRPNASKLVSPVTIIGLVGLVLIILTMIILLFSQKG